ncbi:hypothetical protein FRB95_006808 [Tulasnella sp. JGI-2019a]|nr:hypothetical protein FRB93_004388 [Tulasnella sp. JGI-2019a]KAG9028159.1 hypothetical protein FRB95_006808 [Tulasnella sp. JGI-2019a]
MQTGAVLATIRSHDYPVRSVVFSPQGDHLATGGDDWTVRLWDAVTGAMLNRLNGHNQLVTSVAFSPNGDRLASGSEDETIRLWDVQPGADFTALKCHSDAVDSLQLSTQGDRLVSGGHDNTILLWDVQSGTEVATLTVHSVPDVLFSPDGRHVKYTSGSQEHGWDITSFASTAQADNPSQSVDLNQGHRVQWAASWIMYDDLSICYLGSQVQCSDSRGPLIALGAAGGEVFLLDFTRMICWIREGNINTPYDCFDGRDNMVRD